MRKYLILSFLFIIIFASDAKPIFEQVGYYKGNASDRAFTIYTDTTDVKEMVKYARTKMYTDGTQTVVHFFNNKKYTHLNSSAKDYFAGMWLQTKGIKKYTPYMLGTYQKALRGQEIWYKDSDAVLKEDEEGIRL